MLVRLDCQSSRFILEHLSGDSCPNPNQCKPDDLNFPYLRSSLASHFIQPATSNTPPVTATPVVPAYPPLQPTLLQKIYKFKWASMSRLFVVLLLWCGNARGSKGRIVSGSSWNQLAKAQLSSSYHSSDRVDNRSQDIKI